MLIETDFVLQALDLIRGKNVLLLMDSSLEGQYANDDATKLVELASKCLQFEARERPEIKFLLTAVAPLQRQKEVWFLFLLSMLTFNLHLLFFYLHSIPTVFNFIFLVSFSLSKIFVHHFEFALNVCW